MKRLRWKRIPGFEQSHRIREDGLVQNINTRAFLTIGYDEYGEEIVYLKHKGKRGKRRISVLLRLFEDQSSETRPGGGGA